MVIIMLLDKQKPDKVIGFTQSSYPAYYLPSDEDYKTLSFVISLQRWVKDLEYANFKAFLIKRYFTDLYQL